MACNPGTHLVLSLCLLIGAMVQESAAQPRQQAPAVPPPVQERAAPPINILSIIPSQGEPGATVTLYGAGFTPDISVFLGNQEMPAAVSGPKHLTFELPRLDPGLYALYLRRDDGTTSRAYNFNIIPLKPVATSLSPDTIYACSSGREREVTVTGKNFRPGSMVLFDGAAVRSRVESADSITFSVPSVGDGFHQVQVKNSDDAVSSVLGLSVDGKPEITTVTQGGESVNHYDLVIEGRNFQQNSTLVVTEEPTLESYTPAGGTDTKKLTSTPSGGAERESISFVNCTRLVYRRFPYSTIAKNLRIQVVNPGSSGESSVLSISAP